jgi:hypothetical protein
MKYTPIDFAVRLFGCSIFTIYHTMGFGFIRVLNTF